MAVLFDVLIAAVVIICVISGVKRGFVDTIISLLGFALAIVLAWSFSDKLGEVIDERLVRPLAVRAILNDSQQEGLTPESGMGETAAQDLTLNKKLLALFKDDADVVEDDYAQAQERQDGGTVGQFLNTLLEKQSITLLASKALAVVLVFVGVSVGLWVIKLLLMPIFKLPVLKQFNGLMGGLIGLANAAIIILVLCTAVSFFGILAKTDENGQSYKERVVDKTVFFKYIYENNPVNYIFEKED